MKDYGAASDDNLLPRGGGAFLAEVDGNLTAKRDDMSSVYFQASSRGYAVARPS